MMLKANPIIIAGGGHAGIEAALAISRMGEKATIITLDPKSVGRMSCNPAIGGLAKGHIVKEIDALGGIMGVAADHAGIQFKTLNKSKGRAVWSPRAQVDKIKYTQFIQSTIAEDKNIKATRIAYGVPVGGELEYVDANTLIQAINNRNIMD